MQPTAKGMELMDGSIDGAIVCSSLDLTNYIYGRINVARHMQAHLPPDLRRQDALIKGYDESKEPRLSDYGCVLVPVGTPMALEPGNYVSVVSGRLPNGRRFSGVTLPAMVDR
ncbi:hypothetical protein [Caballeronia sp. SBC1]|uniref:hypothetical protein n=1 Tax=Caballeronia sp. SBC1 TaxID=2705548 RepID=UPI0014083191|nr:hypothetical protein [Caballeronia sp. SBC1]